MPDLFAHQQFGKRVLESLPTYVNVDKEMFMWAQEGPDFWAYWRPWKKNSRNRIVHNESSKQFVKFLISQNPDNIEVFSYALGFLCHVIYDEYAHPFIDDSVSHLQQFWKDCNHTTLERAIDIRMMTQDGKTPRCLVKNWPKKGITPIESAINHAYESIYGWSGSSLAIRSAYRTRFILYLMFWDPLGIWFTLGRLTGINNLKSLSYFGKISPPYVGDSKQNIDMDKFYSTFDNLTNNAINKAVDMVVDIKKATSNITSRQTTNNLSLDNLS